MNTQAISTIILKDIRVVIRTRAVFLPMIIVPIIIMAVIPAVITLPLLFMGEGESILSEFKMFLEHNQATLSPIMQGLTEKQQYILMMLKYQLAPMFLIVPLMVSSVVAADSFAGEKERKTLEALLYTPLSDRELFIAKGLGPWLLATIVSLISFVIYCVVANIVAWPYMERLILPDWTWIILCVWVSPAIAAVALGIMVLVSSRVRSFMEANQLGGTAVLLVLMLFVGQITGVMLFSPLAVITLGLVAWLLAFLLLRIGMKGFARDKIITQV